jgi:hypothetical protein
MKRFLAAFALFISISATAQNADAIYQRACGPKEPSFNVQLVRKQPPAAPEPGKALVYFIQKATGGYFTTRVGLDGAWVGVIQHDSYIVVSVAPGEHHACAASLNRKHLEAELVHFTAEAGKTYYYLVYGIEPNTEYAFSAMEFFSPDSDEALALIASDPQSIATPKP